MQILIYLFLLIASIRTLNNNLGLTPQMGWNSWNKFHCKVTETDVKNAADQIISLGLDKLGYNYVNVDDCWLEENRTSDGHM